jgi:hypothetical protein
MKGGLKRTNIHRGGSWGGEMPMLGEVLLFVSTETGIDSASPRVQVSIREAKNGGNVHHL